VRISSESDRNRFRAEDYQDPAFYIDGALCGGTLTFTVVADFLGRRGQFTGRQFFDAMMNHFGTRRVKIIAAHWSDARPEFRTNLDIFNQETRNGATKVEAAFATKTGQWASDYNFKAINSLDTTPDELPGGYEQVLVEFVRRTKAKSPKKVEPAR
jgi:hypothetical protein